MQPEAVVASLKTAHDADRPAELLLRLAALARDQREQAIGVAVVQPVLADLVRQGRMKGHAPRGAAQLERHKQRGRCSLSKRCRRRGRYYGEPPDPDFRPRAYQCSAVRRPIGSFGPFDALAVHDRGRGARLLADQPTGLFKKSMVQTP